MPNPARLLLAAAALATACQQSTTAPRLVLTETAGDVDQVKLAWSRPDQGDFSAFVIEASPTIGPHWQLRLTPKPGLFAQVFSRIELQGERHVETVVLDERNGDRSTIRFRDLAEAPALSADEVVRLAQ